MLRYESTSQPPELGCVSVLATHMGPCLQALDLLRRPTHSEGYEEALLMG